MADDRYVLKPLVHDGKRGFRLEIDEFMADNAMVNLFLIALAELQNKSLQEINGKPNWLNFYGLAGVHGQPQEAWDDFVNNINYGYCHHGLNTFPTWHRPYMMLYEATIEAEMTNQAKKYTSQADKDKYLDAAARFRLPYWDPIMPRKQRDPNGPLSTVWGVPSILRQKNVYIRKPDAPENLVPMKNPLYSFKFPTSDEWNETRKTKRKYLDQPSVFNPAETQRTPNLQGITDNDILDLNIQRQGTSFANKLWQMLNPDFSATNSQGVKVLVNEERSWNSFANMNVQSSDIGGESFATVSVESWHNSGHNIIGIGNTNARGQMSSPAYAGYDPIFWLHHNNIDRLLALYQSLYGKNVDATEIEGPLYPFKKNMKRECFTSADGIVANYWAPGFAVPGGQPMDKVKDLVKQYLTDTYYWATDEADVPSVLPNWPKDLSSSEALYGDKAKAAAAPMIEMRALTVTEGVPRLVAMAKPVPSESDDSAKVQVHTIKLADSLKTAQAADATLPDGTISTGVSAPKPLMQTWNAHIKVRKFAFNDSFNIHIFVGHVKDDQAERFLTKKNEVGFSGIFASPIETQCASCKIARDVDVISEDVVPLTTQLTDYLNSNPKSRDLIAEGRITTLESLKPEHMVPFLKEHLHWRMTDMASQLLEGREREAKLEVTISSRTFQPPDAENLLGVYGPLTAYPEITQNKAGGFGHVYT